ncbi:MAG TPA: phosphate ABC transporter substrate-binding protein PstS [Actinocrinis sp.]|uniref:phosphate ABC transporter substrate-binding protein PstS n=1 Tax=Actinocrinis sp. TaxID=1920516 RepID=UPI002DDCC632|nr:phosphate ABC transporter substrate-binding protein PstS [Actinocrinis sp.]HEV3172679.1 phosphate ABC transporter substrate-binding protein PstS [Actinocrinis sp.]
MKVQRYAAVAGAGLIAAATLSACGSNNNSPSSSGTTAAGSSSATAAAISCGSGTLTLAGSTAQSNAISKWTKDYQAACSGATINYNPNGSGAGLTAFEQNQVDFAGSDYPMAATDVPKADARCGTGNNAVNIPLVPGAIAVMYNVSGVTSSLNLSAQTLAKIFNGKITTWNDPAIAGENSGVTLPSTKITTFHRSDKSGTSFNFSNYLNKTDAADFPTAANKQWPGTGGQGENGSSGVAQAVKTTDGGIGYAEISYASSNNLQTAKVGNAQGQYVAATTANASAFIAKANVQTSANGIQLAFDYTYSDPSAYPAVLVTYEIACGSGNTSAQLPLIKGFLDYGVSNTAQTELPTAGYVQLPTSIQTQVKTLIDSIK